LKGQFHSTDTKIGSFQGESACVLEECTPEKSSSPRTVGAAHRATGPPTNRTTESPRACVTCGSLHAVVFLWNVCQRNIRVVCLPPIPHSSRPRGRWRGWNAHAWGVSHPHAGEHKRGLVELIHHVDVRWGHLGPCGECWRPFCPPLTHSILFLPHESKFALTFLPTLPSPLTRRSFALVQPLRCGGE
jgi:hypothetical protein